MEHKQIALWNSGEYQYPHAFGFIPNIHTYLHEDEKVRPFFLVVPGGGYAYCSENEGEIIARIFYEKGYQAAVLTYTTNPLLDCPLHDQPLKDIARAVRMIRADHKTFRTLPDRIVICGFSAGAHVCGSLAVHHGDVKDPNPAYDQISARPDGVILSYPVITLGEFTHIYSAQALIGRDLPEDLKEYFSLEKHVTEDTPPCFLWQTRDDNLVPVENSYLFANALREKGINYAHYVFPTGFHGLSVPNEAFFKGEFSDSTMEQLEYAIEAVKAGRGIDVSPERVAELKAQFPDPVTEEARADEGLSDETSGDTSQNGKEMPLSPADKVKMYEDVAMWPDLAMVWMSRI